MKYKEIGSNYSLIDAFRYLKDSTNNVFKDYIGFRCARDAFKFLVEIYEHDYKKVLLPALSCESMVYPFRSKFEIVYYKLNDDYTINMVDLNKKISEQSIFIYQNYFGIESINKKTLDGLTNNYDNLIVVKDSTHDFLSKKNESSNNSIDVISIRKWLPLIDGGLIKMNNYNKKDEVYNNIISDEKYFSLSFQSRFYKELYIKTYNSVFKDMYLEYIQNADKLLNSKGFYRISNISNNLKDSFDLESISSVRVHNSRILYQQLATLDKIKILNVNTDEPLLYLPVIVENQSYFQREMAKRGVFLPVIWPLPEDAIGECDVADYTSNHMLAIPIDQRYDEDDMISISNIIIEILGEL
jgi:dTDP-4-amino-4,6-dideoxygalactose transaminase